MTTYLISSSVMFAFLTMVWKASDVTNALLKFAFLLLSLSGFWMAAVHCGYILKG